MADQDPNLSASPATHLAAADANPVTKHPIRKFRETLIVVAKFWPLWIVLLLVLIGGAVLERAGRGVVTSLVPVIGPWAIRRGAGVTAIAAAPAAPAPVVVSAEAADLESMPG
jgi:hypothetical protein